MYTPRVSSKLTQYIYNRNEEDDDYLKEMIYEKVCENPHFVLHKILIESKAKSSPDVLQELSGYLQPNLNNSLLKLSESDICILLMNLLYLLKKAEDHPENIQLQNLLDNLHLFEIIGYSAAHLAFGYTRDFENKNPLNQLGCLDAFMNTINIEQAVDQINELLINQENSFPSLEFPLEVKDDSYILYRAHTLEAIASHFPKLKINEFDAHIIQVLKNMEMSCIFESNSLERGNFLVNFLILLYLVRRNITSQQAPKNMSCLDLQEIDSSDKILKNEEFVEFATCCLNSLPQHFQKNEFLLAVLQSSNNSIIEIVSDCSENSLIHMSNFLSTDDFTNFEFEQICLQLKMNPNCSAVSKVLFINKIITRLNSIKCTPNAIVFCLEMIHQLPKEEAKIARSCCKLLFSPTRIDCQSLIKTNMREIQVCKQLTKKLPNAFFEAGSLSSSVDYINETLELCAQKFKISKIAVQFYNQEIVNQLFTLLASSVHEGNNELLFLEITLSGLASTFEKLDINVRIEFASKLQNLYQTSPKLQKLLTFKNLFIEVSLKQIQGNFNLLIRE